MTHGFPDNSNLNKKRGFHAGPRHPWDGPTVNTPTDFGFLWPQYLGASSLPSTRFDVDMIHQHPKARVIKSRLKTKYSTVDHVKPKDNKQTKKQTNKHKQTKTPSCFC